MTRKKQGAPQKLDSKNEMDGCDKSAPPQSNGETCHSLSIERPESLNVRANDEDHSGNENNTDGNGNADDVINPKKTANQVNSCQKLLDFTQSFSFSNQGKTLSVVKHEKDVEDTTWSPNWQKPSFAKSTSSQPTSLATSASYDTRHHCSSNNTSAREKSLSDGQNSDSSLGKNEEPTSHHSENSGIKRAAEKLLDDNFDLQQFSSQEADSLKGIDLASLTAAHKFLMDAMRQHKQMYEQCTSNWMSVQQRSDNNCLSKSKAERYRWCVQGGDGQQKTTRSNSTGQSHVNNLKKSASMAGVGVSPVQDKLYSTVFTGASKFCCRDCGSPFNTLVDLTVHMNKTGHFRDTNTASGKTNNDKETSGSSSSKPKKRPVTEDDAQNEKVLTCMGCGHLFDSLQDLSVHMIKTKHYLNVPSLRMWSQKQTAQADNVAETRKRSLPSMMHYKKPDANAMPSSIHQQQAYPHPPISQPPYMTGLNNPTAAAAAAYTSLLYSSPWLAATLPPSFMHSFYAGLPYLYPPGLFAGSFPTLPHPGPSPDSKEGQFSCPKCKETFSSLQQLSEHMAETSHFPDFDPMNSLYGALGSPDVASPKLANPKDTSQTANKPTAASHSSNSSTNPTSTPSRKSHRDYDKVPADRDSSSAPSGSFDFIRSLESTIKSAISKVESPRDDKQISPRNHSSFLDHSNSGGFGSFFSSLTDRPKQDRQNTSSISKHIPSKFFGDKEETSKINPAFVLTPKPSLSTCNNTEVSSKPSTSIAISSNTTGNGGSVPKHSQQASKTSSPLDLTLKREAVELDGSSPRSKAFTKSESDGISLCKSSSLEPTHHSSSDKAPERYKEGDFGLFSSFNRSSLSKTPLQCLHDNMQTFFAVMKPKLEAAIGHNGTQRSTFNPPSPITNAYSSPESYKPIMLPNNPTSSTTDPLQEILKIVNSTDLTKPRMATAASDARYRRQPTLKRPSLESCTPVDAKKSKLSSLLHDLVMPKDESPLSSVNPLQKIQDLVENKLNHSDLKRNGGVAKVGIGSKGSVNESAFSTPSSLQSSNHNNVSTDRFVQRNGFHHITPSSKNFTSLSSNTQPQRNQSREDENVEDDVTLEDLKLEATFARLFASGVPASDKEIGRHLDLSSDKVSVWFGRMTREFQSRGQLPFLRYRDNGINKRMELLCRRCGMVFDTAEQFSSHVNEHFNKKKRLNAAQDTNCKRKEEAPSSPSIRGKCTIQGAVCIGSYKSFKRVMPSHDSGDEEDVKNDPDTLKLLHRARCADESSSNEDITVSS